MRPLLDPSRVVQASLGEETMERPTVRYRHETVRALVLRVYPVGHLLNPTGQLIADVQPLAALPVLLRVPVAATHAQQDTEVSAPRSTRRQPVAPRPESRIEGTRRDIRPGTYVWVTFVNGHLYDPVIMGAAGFDQRGAADAPETTAFVDRVAEDGTVEAVTVPPLDSDARTYPRSVDAFNGSRVEIDNRGNVLVQTTTDREPVWPGHNGVPASPDPEGSYGVSTRGARIGNLVFTTGRHPTAEDRTSVGRQGRRTVGAEDGTIRDETRSRVGNMIRRLVSGVGRYFVSTRGSDDGRVYLEDAQRDYVALGNGRAELHGEDVAVLDAPQVRLGHADAEHEIVLWPQLDQILAAMWAAIDAHQHTGVQTGEGTTGPPEVPNYGLTWSTLGPECRADGVKADKSPAAAPTYQDDPEDE